jgi:hypothetical protein
MRSLLVACLTLKAAMNIHCRLDCLSEGEYGGSWNEKEKACMCEYVLVPAMKINGVILNKLNQDKEQY